MSFIFHAIGSVVNALFGGGGQSSPPPMQMPMLPPPAVTPPPPDRSDADIQSSADRSRRKYGIAGGATDNSLTGGLGVPSGQTYSSVANLLGGVGR